MCLILHFQYTLDLLLYSEMMHWVVSVFICSDICDALCYLLLMLFSVSDRCLASVVSLHFLCISNALNSACVAATVLIVKLNVDVSMFYRVIESKSDLSCHVFCRMSFALHFTVFFPSILWHDKTETCYCVHFKLGAVLFLSSIPYECYVTELI